jgi:hypothetical protein
MMTLQEIQENNSCVQETAATVCGTQNFTGLLPEHDD